MKREQVYIQNRLFGWLHIPDHAAARNTGVVICAPIGWEHIHSHRSLRHLADHLATLGIPALRFDYQGFGDSAGNEMDPERVQCWQNDIETAIKFFRNTTKCEKICLIGIRLGATLAARVSAHQEIDSLVLWNPVINGKRYVRELQAVAATSALESSGGDAFIEVAGFQMSVETMDEIRKINLLEEKLQVKDRVLVVHRNDLEQDLSLVEKLQNDQIPTEQLTLPGYVEMMAVPHFTQLPTVALVEISTWVLKYTQAASSLPPALPEFPHEFEFTFKSNGDGENKIHERTCQFGKEEKIFGILGFKDQPQSEKPVVVLVNSGSVHHVGPNRLYVTLARTLALDGFTTFRIDLQGLGDSAQPMCLRENHPYPETATSDTESALTYLQHSLGAQRFIVLGLCSGAHTAFHSTIDLTKPNIVDTIMINPITYRWVEGMTLDTTVHFQEVVYYKNAMKSSKSWLKFLQGKIQLRYAIGVGFRASKRYANSMFDSKKSSQLSKDLNKVFTQGRPITLFIADHDPGYSILMDGAKSVAKKALKTGRIRLQFIRKADHTFSTVEPRNDLIKKVSDHLKRFW
jgi:alpha-beta hydrolase superfamily lysophospholipase